MKAGHAAAFQKAWRWGGLLILGIAYSVLAYRAAASTRPDGLDALVAVIPLLGLTFLVAWRSSQRTIMLALWVAACVGLYGASAWLVAHRNWVFLLQHASVYALLCAAFGRTLRSGRTPMVTGLARIVHRTMSPALIS